jgi:hypothetical protein
MDNSVLPKFTMGRIRADQQKLQNHQNQLEAKIDTIQRMMETKQEMLKASTITTIDSIKERMAAAFSCFLTEIEQTLKDIVEEFNESALIKHEGQSNVDSDRNPPATFTLNFKSVAVTGNQIHQLLNLDQKQNLPNQPRQHQQRKMDNKVVKKLQRVDLYPQQQASQQRKMAEEVQERQQLVHQHLQQQLKQQNMKAEVQERQQFLHRQLQQRPAQQQKMEKRVQEQQHMQRQFLQPQRQQRLQQQRQSAIPSMWGGRERLRSNTLATGIEQERKIFQEGRQRKSDFKERNEIPLRMSKDHTNSEFLSMIRKYRDSRVCNPLQESDPVKSQPITVCIRKRPLKKTEVAREEVDVIWVPSKDEIFVHEKKSKLDLTKYLDNQQFRFDYTFDENCSNDLVYKYTAKPLVENTFEGGMATCFVYGQTGSGKSHTMGGGGGKKDCNKGIYEMSAEDVFMFQESPKYKHLNLTVSASFFEVYNAEIFDLLANRIKLNIYEDRKKQVKILGLTEKVVNSVDELLDLIKCGNTARISRNTSKDSNPARSHAIFQIVLRTTDLNGIHGKFSLIDLAGNVIGTNTPDGNRKIKNENAEINKSLLAVKECIRAFGRKDTHLPFRNSKLTQILRDSFIGENSKVCMIAMINPGISSYGYSLNTLRYVDHLKQ